MEFFLSGPGVAKAAERREVSTDYSDIKSFKLVNDLFGFAAGDRMIRQIAEALREQPCKGAVYARLEADRFGIFTPEKYASDIIRLLTEREFLVETGNSYIVHIDVCEVLIELVQKHKISPEKLRLEITETALM